MNKQVLVTIMALAGACLTLLTSVVAQNAQPNFTVTRFPSNLNIVGKDIIRYKLTQSTAVDYQLNLYNQRCQQPIATISAGELLPTGDAFGTLNVDGKELLPWLQAGNEQYCLSFCAFSFNQSTQQAISRCYVQPLTVSTNGNQSPSFTRIPSGTVALTAGNKWEFDVQAQDPEGQALSYKFIGGPNFLSMDGQGKLTIGQVPAQPGIYEVVIQVSDPADLSARAFFSLRIPRDQEFVNEQTGPSDSDIAIVSPTTNAVLSGKNNEVKWVISDPQGVAKIVVDYARSGTNTWFKLFEFNGENKALNEKTSNWDVSVLPDSKYVLRFSVTDSANNLIQKLSNEIEIDNSGAGEEVGIPIIINLNPEAASSVDSVRPLISGGLVPGQGYKINPASFKAMLDGSVDQIKCTVTEVKFECAPQQDLAAGSHEIQVSIADTSNRTGIKNWVFNVGSDIPVNPPSNVPPSTNPDPNEEGESTNNVDLGRGSLIIIALICIVAILFIVIPWLLYLLWRRRTTTVNVNPTAANYFNPADPGSVVNVYYPPTPVAPQPLFTPIEPTSYQPIINVQAPPTAPAPIVTTTPAPLTPPPVVNITTAPQPSGQPVNNTATAPSPDWLKERGMGPQPVTTINPNALGSFGYAKKEE